LIPSRKELQFLCPAVRIPLVPLAKDEPLTIPVEGFVSILSFDSKGELDELGIELSSLNLKSSRYRFESLLLFLAQNISIDCLWNSSRDRTGNSNFWILGLGPIPVLVSRFYETFATNDTSASQCIILPDGETGDA